MHNTTHALVMAQNPRSNLAFSAALGTASIYLNGSGGIAGDGFPIPYDGFLTDLNTWDGATNRTDVDEIAISSNDRLSIYAFYTGSDFTIKVYKNGAATDLQVANFPASTNIYACISFTQKMV